MDNSTDDWESIFHQQFVSGFKQSINNTPSTTTSSSRKHTLPPYTSFISRETNITPQVSKWLQDLQSVQWLLHNGRAHISDSPLSAIDDFTPCLCVTGKTGVGKSAYIRALLKQQQYAVLEAHDLFPQDQKEMFLKRLAQALMQQRTVVVIDDTETISNSQLLPIVAFLRKCRKLMQTQLTHVQEHMLKHKTATKWNLDSAKRHLLRWTERSEQMRDPANILDGLSMISGVVFVCHDLDYLQSRLQPLHALCQHIYLPPLSDTDLIQAFNIAQANVIPFDLTLLAARCHGNWHKFYTMLDWCESHQVTATTDAVEEELDRIARYDDLHSKDRVLKQLFGFQQEEHVSGEVILAEMETEHDLDIVVFENQWSLMFRTDTPATQINARHVLWSNELSLMDCVQTGMQKHDTDHEDVAVEFSDVNCTGGIHIDGVSATLTENITSVFEEQQMEFIASWLYALVIYESNQGVNNSQTVTTSVQLKVGKTKRKHERAMENHAKRGEQVCYAPSLWSDHLTKQALVTNYRLRLLHGQQIVHGLSMQGHGKHCELLRYAIEFQYMQFCERQKQRRVSAYTKKIVPFDELPAELQCLMRRHGIVPNQGRVEGTYYFWFKFPGFTPDTSVPVEVVPPVVATSALNSNKKPKCQRK